MRKFFGLSAFALFALLATFQVSVTSCVKEISNHDTITVIHRDTLIQIRIDTVKLVNSDIPNVNSGANDTVQLHSSNDSLRLSGSATVPNGKIVGYLWSQVSGPNTALIANPGSATTYVTKIVAGTYVFQLMAIDDHGATGLKSVSITLLPVAKINLVLKPKNNPFETTIAVYPGSGRDITNPNSTQIDADAWTINGETVFLRGLFRFDLSTLPDNAKILSAKLSLYSAPSPTNTGNLVDANFGSNNALLLQRVTSEWDNSVTWQSQPSTDASSQISLPATNQSLLNLTIDVTDMVKTMAQSDNYGFMLKLQNEVIYNSRVFCSSKHHDATKHPKLVIQYTP